MSPARRSRFLFVFTLAAAGFLYSGCAPKAEPGAAAKPEIALVMKSLANEFFKTMEEGARAHQSANTGTYDLVVNGIKNETDLAQQVNIVEQMMNRGVDAIVIAPADSKALVPVLKRAADSGITVVNIDNRLDADAKAQAGLVCPFVGPDDKGGAYGVGMVLAGRLSKGDKVAIIEGLQTANNNQQRLKGFRQAMEALGADIVGVQSGSWEMHKANTIASALLTTHPDLKAILCCNDSMALGAVAAKEAAGRHDVAIVGYDNITAVWPMLDDGRLLATADQHADQLAVAGIETALAILGGEAPPGEEKLTTVDIIHR